MFFLVLIKFTHDSKGQLLASRNETMQGTSSFMTNLQSEAMSGSRFESIRDIVHKIRVLIYCQNVAI